MKMVFRFLLAAMGASLPLVGCGSDEDETRDSGAGSNPEPVCVAEGAACDPAGLRCCPELLCEQGICVSCSTKIGQACSARSDCCSEDSWLLCGDTGRQSGNVCTLRIGAPCTPEQTDLCKNSVCSGGVCCIPAGWDTTFNPDCCSGRARERYCTHPASGEPYYCGSECL